LGIINIFMGIINKARGTQIPQSPGFPGLKKRAERVRIFMWGSK